MGAQSGILVLIKVGNGAGPEVFTTVGGLQASSIKLDNQAFDTSNVISGNWRQLLANAGISSITISGGGIFTDAASEKTVRGYAFSNSINNYQFVFANGDYLTGAFQIVSYERDGNYNDVETYSITLDSAGAISFTKG
jgi:TP901-1 family phage major tail protein